MTGRELADSLGSRKEPVERVSPQEFQDFVQYMGARVEQDSEGYFVTVFTGLGRLQVRPSA